MSIALLGKFTDQEILCLAPCLGGGGGGDGGGGSVACGQMETRLSFSLCSADETSRRFGVRNFLLSKTSPSTPDSAADLKMCELSLLWGKLIIHRIPKPIVVM